MTTRHFKLFVRERGLPSINILRYIDAKIGVINDMGVCIRIIKINAKDVDSRLYKQLKRKGIDHYPAIITDRGKVKQGVNDIKNLFEKNRETFRRFNRRNARTGPLSQGFSIVPELDSLFSAEMNIDAKTRDDQDNPDSDDTTKDFNRRISDQLRCRKINGNMGADMGADMGANMDTNINRRNTPEDNTMENFHNRQAQEENYDEDNIVGDDFEQQFRQGILNDTGFDM